MKGIEGFGIPKAPEESKSTNSPRANVSLTQAQGYGPAVIRREMSEPSQIIYHPTMLNSLNHSVSRVVQRNFGTTLDLIGRSFNAIQNVPHDQDAILVCGDTGAGKSTLINYLLGLRLTAHPKPGTRTLAIECHDSIARIGHMYASETSIPQRCILQEVNIALWDCPGFEDTSGPEVDVANSFSIREVLKYKADNIKILAVVDESAMTGPLRGEPFRRMISKMRAMFPDNSDLARSIVFCFTKAGRVTDYEQIMQDCGAELTNNDDKCFLRDIVRNSNFEVFHRPQYEGNIPLDLRNRLINKIYEMEPMHKPYADPVISVQSISYLNDFKNYVNDRVREMLCDIVESVKSTISSMPNGDFINFVVGYKSLTASVTQEHTDIEVLTKARNAFMSLPVTDDIRSSINNTFNEIEFLSNEVCQELLGKFIPGGDRFEMFTFAGLIADLPQFINEQLIVKGIVQQRGK